MDDLLNVPSASLPGVRELARRYGVSHTTVERALAYLEELEILAPAERGRMRRINNARLQKMARWKGQTPTQRILFIVDLHEIDLSYVAKRLFTCFRELCARDGFFLSPVEIMNVPPSKLKLLLAELRPHGAILLVLSKTTLDAVHARNIPAVGIGIDDTRFPCFKSADSYRKAWLKAAEAGHVRIAMPVVAVDATNAEWRVRYERRVQRMEQLSAPRKIPFSRNYNLPIIPSTTAEAYHSVLDGLFRHTPPTCLILQDLSHDLAASSFLQRRRLRIPEDVSVIVLMQDPLLADVLPTIAHAELYPDHALAQVFDKLKEQMKGLRSHEQVELPIQWVAGDSLAPPHKP